MNDPTNKNVHFAVLARGGVPAERGENESRCEKLTKGWRFRGDPTKFGWAKTRDPRFGADREGPAGQSGEDASFSRDVKSAASREPERAAGVRRAG